MDLDNDLNVKAGMLASGFTMTDMLSEILWGAAVTTTRAFEKVTLRVDPNTNRVFISIRLRWWAKFKKFEMLHNAWLARAERRVTEHLPTGYKLLIYYDKGGTK